MQARFGACVSAALALATLLSLTVLAGCDSTNRMTNNGGNTPGNIPGGGTGGSGGGGGTGGGGGGTGGSGGGTGGSGGGTGGSSSNITGTVVDAVTHQPITGKVVVALEFPNPGDFSTLMQATADASGHFVFKNVPPQVLSPTQQVPYSLAFTAVSATGAYYQPAILFGGNGVFGAGDMIQPGTDVGTVPLTPEDGAQAAPAQFTVEVTSSDAANAPKPVKLAYDVRTFVADFVWSVPLAVAPSATSTQINGPTCSIPNTACANATVTFPATGYATATFSKSGYTFTSGQFPAIFGLNIQALSTATGKPTCTPSPLSYGTSQQIAPGNVIPLSPAVFTACQ